MRRPLAWWLELSTPSRDEQVLARFPMFERGPDPGLAAVHLSGVDGGTRLRGRGSPRRRCPRDLVGAELRTGMACRSVRSESGRGSRGLRKRGVHRWSPVVPSVASRTRPRSSLAAGTGGAGCRSVVPALVRARCRRVQGGIMIKRHDTGGRRRLRYGPSEARRCACTPMALPDFEHPLAELRSQGRSCW